MQKFLMRRKGPVSFIASRDVNISPIFLQSDAGRATSPHGNVRRYDDCLRREPGEQGAVGAKERRHEPASGSIAFGVGKAEVDAPARNC